MSDKQFIQQAISLATENVKVGGRPFGAVIVKNGQVIAHAVNQITATNPMPILNLLWVSQMPGGVTYRSAIGI